MKNDEVLVRHILDAIDRIENYSNGVNKTEFLSNFMIQDAVIRNLEIIDEASRKISQPTKDKFKEVP